MDINTSLAEINGIGIFTLKKLKKLGIKTVKDLLWHFPFRYENWSKPITIKEAKTREKQNVFVQGKILEIKTQMTWRKKMFLVNALVEDETDAIRVVWFNQSYLTKILKKDDLVSLIGKISRGKSGLYMASPEYEKLGMKKNLIHSQRIVPIYPETRGLTSKWFRKEIELLMKETEINDFLPESIKEKYNLLSLNESLKEIHFPVSLSSARKAQERFDFDQLLLLELFVLQEKINFKKERAISLAIHLEEIKEFIASLPFELTNSQKKALWVILKDLEKSYPMNRLLQGDVGSGKTIVAMIAILNVFLNGFQSVFMSPTEILTQQHFETFRRFLINFKKKINIGLLTGKVAQVNDEKIKKNELLKKIKTGEIDILIGTHALIQKDVEFNKLALVIIDEQHRFGVQQRKKLCKTPSCQVFIPHFLSMTATPIPRSLALTIYGDLNLLIIDELPKGRKKIMTKIILEKEKKETYEFIEKEIKKGRQAFIICPRIEEQLFSFDFIGASLPGFAGQKKDFEMIAGEIKAVKKEYKKFSREIFPDLKIAMLYGKMKSEEKEKIMQDFKERKIDILISTSVIEVGIDVPNATIMIIEGTEHFGLAQLYQLRGRVGRGEEQSYCFLFSENPTKTGVKRLKALIEAKNGLELAEKDLKIRGQGEVFGNRQCGFKDKMLDALRNIFLVEKIRNCAKDILIASSGLKKFPLLSQEFERFKNSLHRE